MTNERFYDDLPDFVKEAEETLAKGQMQPFEDERQEVTIKFGRGLVGDPFTAKSGKEFVKVHIPNPDPADTRPWESFVISPKMIHDNKYGKGVWMKLPENETTRLSRPVPTGVNAEGKEIWKYETREVTSTELKALLESYKERSRGSNNRKQDFAK